MKTHAEIVENIGADALAAAVGVTRKRVLEAVSDGEFPASWYDLVERMTGQPPPRDLFTFKRDSRT